METDDGGLIERARKKTEYLVVAAPTTDKVRVGRGEFVNGSH